MIQARKYALPPFLRGLVLQTDYEEWVHRKARAHVKRDRKRGNPAATIKDYKGAIHRAVCQSDGNDAYTGERLRWDLIRTYCNDQSKLRRREYKRELFLLPTVDHVGDGTGAADFKICSWRTNDAKSDLPLHELVELCCKVLTFAGYRFISPDENGDRQADTAS